MRTKRIGLTDLAAVILFGLCCFTFVFISEAEGAPEWQATVQALMTGGKGTLVLGADSTATDGYDNQWDSYAMLGGSLRAYFPRPEWHPVFQKYWRDIRAKAPGSTTEWSFIIESDTANAQITLTWDLSFMPGDYTITLLDDTSNQSIDMRTAASYRFTYTAARNFRVLVYTPAPVEPPAENQSPVANAGPDQIIEMASCDGASVTLDGSMSTDPDGDALSYIWTWEGGSAEGVTPTVQLPMGTTSITLAVDDGRGGISSDTVNISINDSVAAVLDVKVAPNILWPANGRYVKVTPTVTVSDVCVPKTKIELLSVTSNEPDINRRGGDNTVNDIVIKADGSIYLRAERDVPGKGRLYSITYQATDEAGNKTTGTALVNVPVSRKW